MMTPERLKYIKEHYDEYGTVPDDGELLVELDRVRTVAGQQVVDNAFKCSDLRKERDQIRAKLDLAVEWIESHCDGTVDEAECPPPVSSLQRWKRSTRFGGRNDL